MKDLTAAIVTTTIGEGEFLDHYVSELTEAGFNEKVFLIAIPDLKTPNSLFQRVHALRDKGCRLFCPTIEEQEAFLTRLGLARTFVPYDSDNRRNIGFLMALELGCDFLISIDDDNFCLDGREFIQEHSVVCLPAWEGPTVNSSSGWFNICNLLELDKPGQVYPRGFPYGRRHQMVNVGITHEEAPVRVNVGLWLREPDLDAATWLTRPVSSLNLKKKSVLLGDNSWSPINSQNTALHRSAVVAYHYVRMGYPIGGVAIDRYGDIFSGYFCQACVRHLGHRIRVGTPLVNHCRNSHHYLRDLTSELAGMWIIEDLAGWLPEARLLGNTYAEAYLSLAEELDNAVEHFRGFIWTDATRRYFHEVTHYMRLWVSVCERVLGEHG